MAAKVFLRVIGIVFTLVGILGFFVPFKGLLNLTVTHDVIHLSTGVISLLASRSVKSSVLWSRIFGVVYLIVAILGLFVQNLFGLIMLMPGDTVIHFVVAIGALIVGFAGVSRTKSAEVDSTF